MIKPEKYKTSAIVRWLWRASHGARSMVVTNTLLGLLTACLSLLFVWFCKETIDIATGDRDGNILLFAALLVGTRLVEIALTALSSWMVSKLGVRTQNRLRHSMFSLLIRSEWRGIEQHHSGDVLNRLMTDINTISGIITDTAPYAFVTLFQLVASFFFLYSMDHTLALIIVVIMPLFMLGSRFYIRRMRAMTKDVRQSDSRIQSVMQESLQHKTVIKTLEQDREVLGRLGDLQGTLEEQVIRRTRFSIGTRVVVSLGFALGYLTAFLWGAFSIRGGLITFGVMTAFLQLVGRVQRPITDLMRMVPTLVGAFTAAERLMELEETPQEEDGDRRMMTGTAGLTVSDVTFRYADGDCPVFDHFSADFPPCTATAILGETGVGKTTLIRLLLGLVHPTDGSVSIYSDHDEAPVSPLTRCNFVYVPQGNTLFSGTIRDNLLMGRPDATDEELIAVLHTACADFVSTLPNGLDTLCGESGGGLSEGQAQRIAIARSLLRPGSILLLDEATSALDTQTERLLLERITAGDRAKTLIFITHRPSIIDYCDRVIDLGRHDVS